MLTCREQVHRPPWRSPWKRRTVPGLWENSDSWCLLAEQKGYLTDTRLWPMGVERNLSENGSCSVSLGTEACDSWRCMWLRHPCGSGSTTLARKVGVVWTHIHKRPCSLPAPTLHLVRSASARQKWEQQSVSSEGQEPLQEPQPGPRCWVDLVQVLKVKWI